MPDNVGTVVGVDVDITIKVGVGGGGGVLVAVGSWTLMGVRVAVGSTVAVGGVVGVAVGGVVGMGVGGVVGMGVDVGGVVGMGVSVAGGLGVLVGVGVGGGEGLQLLTRGSKNSPPMTQKQRRALFLETVFIMIVLTSGKRFRVTTTQPPAGLVGGVGPNSDYGQVFRHQPHRGHLQERCAEQ